MITTYIWHVDFPWQVIDLLESLTKLLGLGFQHQPPIICVLILGGNSLDRTVALVWLNRSLGVKNITNSVHEVSLDDLDNDIADERFGHNLFACEQQKQVLRGSITQLTSYRTRDCSKTSSGSVKGSSGIPSKRALLALSLSLRAARRCSTHLSSRRS